MFGRFYNPHNLQKTGNVLNGSIQNKFIGPWVKHIRKLGGQAHPNQAVRKLLLDDKDPKKISGFLLSDGSTISADHYVLALPFSKLKHIITTSGLDEPFSRKIPNLHSRKGEKWGHCGHFALKRLPEGASPSDVHVVLDSPWAIVYQYITKELWEGEPLPSEEAPVHLWVTCSDATTPGIVLNKPYSLCTEKEFLEELLAQIYFGEESKGLIVDAVVGKGLDWWDSSKKTPFPDPSVGSSLFSSPSPSPSPSASSPPPPGPDRNPKAS